MRILMYLVIFFSLISCASTQSKVDVRDKIIGVHYFIDEELKICHSHIGTTVFQNKNKEFVVKESFNKIVTNGYVAGINSSGNTAIQIKSDINWADYLTYSKWDASAKLDKEGLDKLSEVGKNEKLDYLVIARDYSNFFNGQACSGSHLKTNNQGIINFVPVYSALVFNPSNGDFIGSTFISNKKHEEIYTQVSNPQELNEDDISKLVNYSEKAAYKAIKLFLNAN